LGNTVARPKAFEPVDRWKTIETVDSERGGPLPSITVRMRCWVSLDDPVVFVIDSVRMCR
jgi:hypothetical protein